ncbi:MAG: hypothetical protein ACQEWM_06090 [Actinomycetota bacterium]
MATTRADPRSSAVASGIAISMALAAAIAIAVADAMWFGIPTADGAGITLVYVVGWVLLGWAALLGLAIVVHRVRSGVDRRPAPIELVLLAATAAVIVGVLLTHPLIGSGQGFGTALG